VRRRSIAELSAEVAANPDSTAAVELAQAYRERGDLDRALRLCLRGLERHPTLVSAHYELGCIYWARGERQLALDEWSTVKRLAPEHVEARGAIARSLASEGRSADAMREVRAALAIRPDDRALQKLLEEIGDATPDGDRAEAATQEPVAAGPPGTPAPAEAAAPAEAPAREVAFAGIASTDEWMGAVVVNERGEPALGGIDADGREVGATLAAHLAGAPEEASGATSYLGLGAWRSLTVESDRVRLLVEPLDERLLIVAAHPETPPGRTLRIREAVRRDAERRLGSGER
jgi:tetratricopeptide (TPR) repeat protein